MEAGLSVAKSRFEVFGGRVERARTSHVDSQPRDKPLTLIRGDQSSERKYFLA